MGTTAGLPGLQGSEKGYGKGKRGPVVKKTQTQQQAAPPVRDGLYRDGVDLILTDLWVTPNQKATRVRHGDQLTLMHYRYKTIGVQEYEAGQLLQHHAGRLTAAISARDLDGTGIGKGGTKSGGGLPKALESARWWYDNLRPLGTEDRLICVRTCVYNYGKADWLALYGKAPWRWTANFVPIRVRGAFIALAEQVFGLKKNA